MQVAISSQVPASTQNFTAAHELGHAVMHNANGMHRDRALDGSSASRSRERVEVEADKFASYFLMPTKQIKVQFNIRFLTMTLKVDDTTAFLLIGDSQQALRRRFDNRRQFTRFLAETGSYSGLQFRPLAEHFRVSIEAMAIRIEEMGLASYP